MGDSRARVKIEFSIYGETYNADMSINYFPTDGLIDDRVTNFFDASYRDAKGKFDEAAYKSEEGARNQRREAEEREELDRLKRKYEK